MFPDRRDPGSGGGDGRTRQDAERQLPGGDGSGRGANRQSEPRRHSDAGRETQVLHQMCHGDGRHDVGRRGGRGGCSGRTARGAAETRGHHAGLRDQEGPRRLRHGLPHTGLLAGRLSQGLYTYIEIHCFQHTLNTGCME